MLKSLVPASIKNQLKVWLYRNDFPSLCSLFMSDKWGHHWYAKHYQRHFQHLKNKTFNLLEIGVGGYDKPDFGGHSLRAWKAFFPKANIFAIDIFDKSPLQEPRITIFKGSQNDPDFLSWVVKQIGSIQVIVDDGSHINEHVITSFNTLFPYLSNDGIYAIEDLQTSYWSDFGGSEDVSQDGTGISLIKSLIDGLNWEEFHTRHPSPFDSLITGISVYHNLAFIYKGINREGSDKDKSRQFTQSSYA